MNRLVLVFFSILLLTVLCGCSQHSNAASSKTNASKQFPLAHIDSITPENVPEGQSITLQGHGTAHSANVVAYSWRSSLDGNLGTQREFTTSTLSAGQHFIYFKVKDSKGMWSNEDMKGINILSATPINADKSPVINFFLAEPATITAGEFTTLSWDVSNASRIVIEPQIGKVGRSGSLRLSPAKSTTYTVSAINPNSTVCTSITAIVKSNLSRITDITISGPEGSGSCSFPLTMDFSGTITTDGPCTVEYQWEGSNGVVSPRQSIITYVPCTSEVTYSFSVTQTGEYRVRLHTLAPNEMFSPYFSVSLNRTDGVITDVTSTGVSTSGINNCPVTVYFSCSITMDGPGTVTYLWLRSDGIATPTYDLAFAEASTQTVTYTWQIDKYGTYWVLLHTVKPNVKETTNVLPVSPNCR